MQKSSRDEFRKNRNKNKGETKTNKINKNNKNNNNNDKMSKKDIQLSKKLSFVLRHGAKDLSIAMQSDGFVMLEEMCAKAKIFVPFSTIKNVVDNNNKKRFQLIQDEEGNWKIRASQGHTIKEVNQDLLLKKISI